MILCSSTLWLNDAIINAAQMLLKQQAGDNYVGFQSTLLGKNLKYKLVEREKATVADITCGYQSLGNNYDSGLCTG